MPLLLYKYISLNTFLNFYTFDIIASQGPNQIILAKYFSILTITTSTNLHESVFVT